ncbi:tetratricopeptide repeat protein [Aquimarina sp. M1]
MALSIKILLFFVLFTTTLFSQNPKIDSLKTALEQHNANDTTKVVLLYKLAYSNFQRDVEKTRYYLDEAESLSNTLNFAKGKAKVFFIRGILENRKSNYKKSLDFFEKALEQYKSIQDKSGMADIYVSFGITNYDLAQYYDALDNYKKATEIYKKLDDKRNLITCLINSANVYSELGRYDSAISNYKEALIQSKVTKDEDGISYVHHNLGTVYMTQGNYPLAIKNLKKSLVYEEKMADTLSMANLFNSLGQVYRFLKKDGKALEYHKKSLSFAKQIGSKKLVASNNNNIGDIYLRKRKYNKALGYFQNALETSRETNDLRSISLCLESIGKINLRLKKPLNARKDFEEAEDISRKIDNKYVLSASLLGISETFLQEKQYQKAISYANKGKHIAEASELLEVQKKAAELLYNIYRVTKKYEKALVNHEILKLLNDSLFNKENIEKITSLEYEYKYKQVLDSASMRELKLTKTVLTTSQNLEKSQKNYLLAIIGVLLISIVLGAIIFYQKLKDIKSKTKNNIIEQKLLRSQMTPHFIFNALSVLQGMILNKENKKSISYLSKFSKLLRITLENSRDMLVTLEQELIGVNKYLELQNLQASLAFQYTVIVDSAIDASQCKIPPMLIQPFVENSIEHGFEDKVDNRKIDICIKFINKSLICTITDNGVGINAKKNIGNGFKKSLATTITAERLKILSKYFKSNGDMKIEDRTVYNEQGTIVTLTIPYKKDIL